MGKHRHRRAYVVRDADALMPGVLSCMVPVKELLDPAHDSQPCQRHGNGERKRLARVRVVGMEL
jgi:hypothetical protein